MSRYQPTKEYAAQIRRDLKERFPDLKFSVKCDGNSIGIALMQAPKTVFTGEFSEAKCRQIGDWRIQESEVLNSYGKEILLGMKEVVKKYHWNESRPEIDFFLCSFYYNLSVGRWDKPFEVKGK